MTKPYLIATNTVEHETIVNRSRFICYLAPCTSIEEAKAQVKQCQLEHPQASHHCYSFLTKAADNSLGYGYSDDGEPSGTAGKPMLAVLQGGGVGQVCAIVARYFGGTKLGTGGLQRAYGDSVRQALVFLQSKIKIASNISLNSIYKKEILKTENELKLVFFSRISPKKNLLYALELLVNINNVSIDIYGSIEDQNYWKKCNQLIASKNINATYKDEILPVNVSQTLSDYHFLLLPTLHENFGHVIVEALTAGCGLIISNETPWRNLEEKNIGWDIELNNKNKFLEVIKSCVSLNSENYNAVRNSCYNFVEDELNSKKEIEDTKKLFI